MARLSSLLTIVGLLACTDRVAEVRCEDELARLTAPGEVECSSRNSCTNVDCEARRCGELDSMFESADCLRPDCYTHDDCASGTLCYQKHVHRGSGLSCGDELDGSCLCLKNQDIQELGLCVPVSLIDCEDPEICVARDKIWRCDAFEAARG